MDRDFFLNSGLRFEPTSQMQSWKLMSPVPELNFPPEQSQIDRFTTFDSTLSSLVSSPVSNAAVPNDSYTVHEFVDNLGIENRTNLRNSIPFGRNLPSLATDPGFAERAAKFSCFGSRSFNGQTGLNSNNRDLHYRSSVSPLMKAKKMHRVSSSPSLNINGSAMEIHGTKNLIETGHMDDNTNSNEESSVSEHMDVKLKNMNDSNSRKRKAATLKGKAKEIASAVVKKEGNEDLDSKKVKKTEDIENGETEKKSTEPPKDYIHVRARRGEATDSHSLAERVRREKISERMKLLQDLVPGCNKVTGKALMLDEIINYVQSLQHQVEFLSMKLATVNSRQDLDMNSHISTNINQPNVNLSQELYPMESSTSEFYEQKKQVVFIGSTQITHSSVDPLPPPVHGFTQTFSQFAGFEGDDLHSIVKMSFGENSDQTSDMRIEL